MTALLNSLDKLTTLPTIGRPRSDLPDGYQMHSVGKHIIIYHAHYNRRLPKQVQQ
jgi:plasmid stabilization system protein ParE